MPTFLFAELIESLEPGLVVGVVRLERDAEEVAVWRHSRLHAHRLGATQSVHFPVDQFHVEIREFDVVALRVICASKNK